MLCLFSACQGMGLEWLYSIVETKTLFYGSFETSQECINNHLETCVSFIHDSRFIIHDVLVYMSLQIIAMSFLLSVSLQVS